MTAADPWRKQTKKRTHGRTPLPITGITFAGGLTGSNDPAGMLRRGCGLSRGNTGSRGKKNQLFRRPGPFSSRPGCFISVFWFTSS